MMRPNWSLIPIHTAKLIDYIYVNTFFSPLVDTYKFYSNIKGIEIVAQIVIYSMQNQINT